MAVQTFYFLAASDTVYHSFLLKIPHSIGFHCSVLIMTLTVLTVPSLCPYWFLTLSVFIFPSGMFLIFWVGSVLWLSHCTFQIRLLLTCGSQKTNQTTPTPQESKSTKQNIFHMLSSSVCNLSSASQIDTLV